MGYMKSHLQFHRVLGGMVWRMKGECKQSLGRMITFSPRIDLFSSLLYPGPGETQSEPGTESNIFELRHFWLKFEPPIYSYILIKEVQSAVCCHKHFMRSIILVKWV